MKIALISDTHLRHRNYPIDVPAADMVIHSGDACIEGTAKEVRQFFDWFGKLPHRHKVFVAGNHDWLFEKDNKLARSLVPAGVTYLQDELVEIEGIKIYGAPWQPEFCEWAFNLKRGFPLRKKWEAIPAGIDILVTHGPPMGILDWSSFGDENAGCEDLRRELLRVKPKLHVFGHIHGDYGTLTWANTLFVNAALCNEAYVASNPPILVDLGKEAVLLKSFGIEPPRGEAASIREIK